MEFLSNLISGLSLGAIYALIALGYTMVYGIAKMLNFAHGDVIMIGAFTVLATVATAGFPWYIGIIASVIVCTVLGVTIEKIAYKPLRKANPLSVLITAIGVSYFLQSVALLIFGSGKQSFPTVIKANPIKLGSLIIQGNSVVTLIITTIIMVVLTLFINKTRLGKAMRAVSEDKDAAELMGISVNRTISLTFAIGSALAAVAGIFYGSTYGFVDPYAGAMPGIKAFVAAVFGGIGSIPGAMLGGILLGIIENLSKAYISTDLADAIVFGVLIVVLIVKPTGLLGKKIREKV
ncbi:MAG: branched-chain amino acid ABC transporter permease [Lachnospiraceae bacterium]|nr:branched-chain amino acid ABC transporter permease [Lachnospiraceae bacterium]